LLDAGAVHALDEPAPREHDNPLRRGILVPVAYPADWLHGEDHCRFAALHLVIPLRICGSDTLKFIVRQRALLLSANPVAIDVQMPIGE
jgi:hypothetical protein